MSTETKPTNTLEYAILNNSTRVLFELFKSCGYELYAVGGCIRNVLLNKKPKDIDFCTDATTEEMKAVMAGCPIQYEIIPTGEKFGTLTIRFPSEDENYEITVYRIDGRYSDNRHPTSITPAKTLAEDLSRRDFTCNAIAWNPSSGVFDPFGGITDIMNRTLRCVGEADKRFSEDALRVLRMVRFALRYNFVVEQSTLTGALKYASETKNLSLERIGAELKEILSYNLSFSSQVVAVLCRALNSIGIDLKQAYTAISYKQPLLRWFTLFHNVDCNKFAVGKSISRGIRNIGYATKYIMDNQKDVIQCKASLGLLSTEEERLALLEWAQEVDNNLFSVLVRAIVNKEPCSIADLAVNGDDVMWRLGIDGGKEIQNILIALRDSVLRDSNRNSREYLLALADVAYDEVRRREDG